ncbi:polysaccharide deacetylase family protein [Sphingobacterium haloxyli]|uniref:Polysaccharide deacetylase family protein n=1 Tax=Sphingobacterium haloxyli TaxID=2100533 RepID=A0A2S9J7Y5_9SPHI|nr:polysaccharide deacetylase family protein [Sphingobacterium haloxyli]PRD48903.1 polysaccharide deacetylase family protein [Sphingobacterium haloxyli]
MLKHAILYPLFLVAGCIASLVGIFGGSFIWFLVVLLLAIGLTTWGAFDIRLGYFTPTFFRKKYNAEGRVALTFDDGPSLHTTEVLRLLKAYQSKATFFCIGKQVLAYPHIAKQIVDEGHTIGNHTYAHPKSFGFLKEKDVVAELEQCSSIIYQTVGKTPKLFRPPFGVTNPSVAKGVQYTKQQIIGWSNRSLDTVTLQEDKIYERVCKKLKSGDIILFHDTSQRTVNVLKRLLPYLQKQGYISVSVDDLLNLHGYEK